MLSVIMPHAIMLSVMVLVMLQSKKEKHLAILTNHSVILDDQHSELQLWLPWHSAYWYSANYQHNNIQYNGLNFDTQHKRLSE